MANQEVDVNPVQDNAWVTDTAQYGVSGPVNRPPVAQPIQAPIWTTQNDWTSTFTSRQDTLSSVYTRYLNELQSQGYRLQSSDQRGNHITAKFRGNGTAELSVKQEGRSGRFEVKIVRRS